MPAFFKKMRASRPRSQGFSEVAETLGNSRGDKKMASLARIYYFTVALPLLKCFLISA